MDLADIQKAVICIGLDSIQCKVHLGVIPNSDQGPKFLLRVRAGPLAWSRAKFRLSRQVGLRGSPRGGLLMWLFSRADDSRWRDLGYHF